jgi:hypothetical protein
MPQLEKRCSTCGGRSIVVFGQRCLGGNLIWSGSEACQECGARTEFDDYGDIPEDLKPLVLQEEGEWSLHIMPSQDTIKALKLLRARLGLPISDVKAKLNNLRGTKAKMMWLQDGLRLQGVESTLKRIDPDGH